MDTLHKSVYDVAKAISALVPQGGPVLCRDEMEEWSASEASLFEEALEKYGKDFTDIQQDFVSAGVRAEPLPGAAPGSSWLRGRRWLLLKPLSLSSHVLVPCPLRTVPP